MNKDELLKKEEESKETVIRGLRMVFSGITEDDYIIFLFQLAPLLIWAVAWCYRNWTGDLQYETLATMIGWLTFLCAMIFTMFTVYKNE